MKTIILIKTGVAVDEAKLKYGDFEDWFSEGMGKPDVTRIDVYLDQPLPAYSGLDGVVITGSAAMVSHREDWSERTAAWLRGVVNDGVPVLGVCYGHQLLAHALGGRVGPNPNGRQMGTVPARLLNGSAADPLLGHLPNRFPAQTSHFESVLELPPGAERLAHSPLDDNFAIRYSENAWGVQFHPEFSGAVMTEYIVARRAMLRQEGLDPDHLLAATTDTPEAKSVLRTFVSLNTWKK